MATDCAATELELADAALGEPAPAHAATCEACRRALDQHRAMWAAVQQLPRLKASPAVRAAVLAAAASLRPAASASPAAATGRDVRARILEAARRQAATGRPPKSLERFRHVPAGATAPPGSPAPEHPARRRFVLIAGFAAAALLLTLALWEPSPEALEVPLVAEPAPPPPPASELALTEPALTPPPLVPPPLVPAPRPPLFVAVCSCSQREQAAVRDSFLVAMGAVGRVMRPEDPALELATAIFAIGPDALDAALALPARVPIVFALVPQRHQRPGPRTAFELGLAPTRRQLEEIDRALPGRRPLGILAPGIVTTEIEALARVVHISTSDLRDVSRVQLLWAIGLEGAELEAVFDAGRAAGVPVVVSGTDASRRGAVLSFVPDTVQVGASAADALRELSQGRTPVVRDVLSASAFALRPSGSGTDPQVAMLGQELARERNAALRSRTIGMLAVTRSPDAVRPLCDAVHGDLEPKVRASAAAALEALGLPAALDCLRRVQNPPARVLEAIAVIEHGRLCRLTRVQPGSLSEADLELAVTALSAALAGVGCRLDDGDAGTPPQYELQLGVHPNGPAGLKLELTVRHEGSYRGSWNVKASGGSHSAMLKAMVPKVVNDLAYDLEWR